MKQLFPVRRQTLNIHLPVKYDMYHQKSRIVYMLYDWHPNCTKYPMGSLRDSMGGPHELLNSVPKMIHCVSLQGILVALCNLDRPACHPFTHPRRHDIRHGQMFKHLWVRRSLHHLTCSAAHTIYIVYTYIYIYICLYIYNNIYMYSI